ncbi:tetratricopeptide repeat protein [Bradyrhizobium sp. WYCCWR 13023]|uniref:protein O-GlcNAc transferase n=1 Tax=Bradyrhizobium zhengyangense TaxID=2911009 RepID=A0A9X1R9X1_9BRAD|nr:tetratricopeptide repeat protein [Bradyrhizobium zhengyangense]MCG2626904.1 tetratricopeptide repeat protein [Bradyrhizobium zhengyangense]MCG2638009.1 tetratricopeptide repeat protein [Bradyrhizobium zhengyangense]
MAQQSRNKGASAPISLHPSAGLDQAIAAHRSGNLLEAERAYTTILKGSKTHPVALHMLGLLRAQRGDFADAEPLLKKAARLDGGNPHVLFNYANVLRALSKTDDALVWLAKAIALSPDFADAYLNRGAILMARQELHGAIAEFERAIAIAPSSAAFANRGSAFQQLGQLDQAHDSYQRAVALAPSNPQNHFALSEVLGQMGRHDEAIGALERTVALDKAFPFALSKLVDSRRKRADWRSFEREQAGLDEAVESGVAVDPFTFLHASSSPARQLTCAKTFVAKVAPERGAARPRTPSPVSRLRIGYMSADFRNHAIGHLMVGVIEEHDRERFEVSAISYGPDDRSELRDRLKAAFERFEDVSHLPDEDVVKLIRQLDIEVLVDLGGFTAGARPRILAHRAAPIQVNYLGYPGTMGAPYMDYVMADPIIVPEAEQKHYSEKVIYLPDSYQATDARRSLANVPARSEVGLADDAFVYCAFNRTSKITPVLFDVWMRLLAKTAGSVLWLLDGDPIAKENLKREAVARGIAAERIVFASHAPADAHLARHQLADLYLDTLPYNAHTAASDALWAGLPVVTCLGTAFAGRVAASILNAVGLPELVTQSLDDYESLALRIAHDPELRAALKGKLASQRTTWPLFDTARMTRHIEKAFNEMWRRHCAGEAPASFAV